jgi:hypothetical protein
MLSRCVSMRQIAADDDELGRALRYQGAQIALHLRLFPRPCMEVRDLQDA